MTIVIDTIKSPPVDAMRAAGVVGVSRYLYWNDSRDNLNKVIEKPEFDWLHSNGFDVMLNWEGSARDWLGGAAAAKIHATEAVRQARALGYPAGCTIYGSVDFDMTLAEWNGAGRPYGQTYSSVTRDGGYVAGVYGPWDVLGWCQQLGGGVFGGFWQTMSTAWSGGRNAQLWPGAHLRQRGSMTIGGQDCDYNDIIQANYGQAGGDMLTPEDINAVAAAVKDKVGGGPGSLTIDQLSGWLANGYDPRYPDAANLSGPKTGKPSLREILDAVKTSAPVTMTEQDRAAIVAGVTAEIGGKLDQLLARLAAAGQALNG